MAAWRGPPGGGRHPVRASSARPTLLGRWRSSDPSGSSPGGRRTRTACGAATAGSPAPRRSGCAARGPRRSSTSATAPRPSPRWSCTTGCSGSPRRPGRRRGDRPGPRRGCPSSRAARPDLPGRGVRGAARAGARPVVVRAFNVLRQYAEPEVAGAWATMAGCADRLLVDGTCDELGRLATWVAVTADGPVSLSLSGGCVGWTVRASSPSASQGPDPPQRPGEGCTGCSPSWTRRGPGRRPRPYGVRQRFIATGAAMRGAGWPLLDGPSRWRLGERRSPGMPSRLTRGRRARRCGRRRRPITWSRAA